MRLKKLINIFDYNRLLKLRHDFNTPFKALLASSGAFKSSFDLVTKDSQTMQVGRADDKLWTAYFNQQACEVNVEQAMFKVRPSDNKQPVYFIAPGHNCMTHQPQRWNKGVVKNSLVNYLQQAEKAVYSQHGEDGILEALLDKIPVKRKFIVEFGAYDGINMSNSRYLIKDKGWSAFLIEGDKRFYSKLKNVYPDQFSVKILKSLVTPENIDQLFTQADVPVDFEVLSIDIDSIDYYVWQGLLMFTPKIVVVEYNSVVSPEIEYIVDRNKAIELSGTSQEGASLLAYDRLAREKNYQLVYTELSGSNAFFIHDSIKQYFPETDWTQLTVSNLYQPPQFGELAGGKAVNGRGYR